MTKTLRPRIGRLMVFGLAVAVLIATWKPTPVATAPPREAAAVRLDSQGKLLCARTFRATGWVNTNDAGYNNFAWREQDQDPTDPRLCGLMSNGYRFMYISTSASAGPGLNGYPSLQTSGQYRDNFLDITPWLSELQGTTGRWGIRFYRWSSADHLCGRGKNVQFYNFAGLFSDLRNVVWGFGTYGLANSPLSDNFLNWWRWELYFDRINAPTTAVAYIKNITTGRAEDSMTVPDSFGMWPGNDPGRMDPIHEYYDRDAMLGETCTTQHMFFVAAKNLGPNERIPPAVEMEGGAVATAGPGSTPSAPTAVTVR